VRVYIRTYGCKVNQVESEELAARLVAEGHELVRDEELAQLYVINGCTVTGEADTKVRKGVRHAASLSQVEQVVVTGCAAVMHADELAALGEKVVVAASSSKLNLATDLTATLPSALSFHTRAPVKVQDGCENFCSYCIVPYARGACRSMPMAGLVGHVEALAADGTQEIVLTGINIGRYCDPETGADLPTLIRALYEQGGVHRIRLSSIEPPDVTKALCNLLAEGILCEHLHIPLQSGSDAVLKAMGRRYTAAGYAAALVRVRAAAPQTAISTDVIVGYPTETDADFEATYDLCKALAFSKIHVFRFSPRTGTPAAALPPLDPHLVAARAARLRELSSELAVSYAQAQMGRMLEWVVERVDPVTDQATLTSREHLSMRISAADRITGELLTHPFDMMRSVSNISTEIPAPRSLEA